MLIAAGLHVGATSRTPSKSAVGTVLSSNPAPGTKVAPGTGVELVISSGPPLCQVPDVTGQSVAAATSAIKEACAAAVTVTTESADAEPNTVLRTSPPAGSKVPTGGAIRLIAATADEVTAPVHPPTEDE